VEEESTPRFSPVLSNLLFATGLLLFCECEATVIRTLWFRAGASFNVLDAIEAPFMLLCPVLMGLGIRFAVGRFKKLGQISSSAAGSINLFLGLLMMTTYLMAINLKNLTLR
jgi:hypothetical protein